MALYISYLTSWCPHGWLQMLFLVYLFIWTGNVSVTFQMFWTLHWQKTIYRQRWSNAHVPAVPGWFNGCVCHSPFTLSLYPGQVPQEPDLLLPEQRSLPMPCGWGVPAVLACCHAPAGFHPPVERQSTWKCHPGPQQLQQVLPYVDRKRSGFQRSGASFPQNIHEWPFEGLSDF